MVKGAATLTRFALGPFFLDDLISTIPRGSSLAKSQFYVPSSPQNHAQGLLLLKMGAKALRNYGQKLLEGTRQIAPVSLFTAAIGSVVLLSGTARFIEGPDAQPQSPPAALSPIAPKAGLGTDRPLEQTLDRPRTVAALREIFQDYGYVLSQATGENGIVPALFLTRLPEDYTIVPAGKPRKEMFVQIALPLILKVNADITQNRERLLDLQKASAAGTALSLAQKTWLHEVMLRYDLRDAEETAETLSREAIDFSALLERMDVIPVSLALAQGSVESGWGSSRFARKGQALFGQWTWDPNSGIVPRERQKGKTHLVRRYDTLLEGVRAYALNLNRNRAYQDFRAIRAQARAQGQALKSHALANGLTRYSELGAVYVREIQKMIRYNRLTDYDFAQLARPLARSAAHQKPQENTQDPSPAALLL